MKKSWLIFAIVLLVIVCERMFSLFSLFDDKLELMTYDLRAKIATDNGPFGGKFKPADKRIVMVIFDDFSRREIGKNPQLNLSSWPWRRDVWGGVVDFIEQGKPKAILFDLVFNGVNDNFWNDKRFAGVLQKYDNVVLATTLNDPKYLVDEVSESAKSEIEASNSEYLPAPKSLNVKFDNEKINNSITYYSHAPVQNLYTEHNMMGVVNKVVRVDSVIRKNQPIFKLVKENKTYYMPSLAFAGFLKYMGEDGDIVVKNNEIRYKDRVIPINEDGEINIAWHGLGKNYSYMPISRLLLSEGTDRYVKPSYFKDKIVIIGSTEAGRDIHPSSVNPSYMGPESNATALDNFINDTDLHNKNARKFISRMSKSSECTLVFLSCLFVIFLGFVSKNALIGFINSFVSIILYVLICVWLFANPAFRIWVPIVTPLYYLLMTSGIVFAFKFQKELAKRASVTDAFGKFVSPKVLATLLKEQDNLILKSTKKRITMMFCDVKDFTTLSEKCNPQQLVDNLNELFNEIVNVIFKNEGTVDKFIGDCIMAYWGDPIAHEDDSFMAVKTALEIKEKVNELKIKNAHEGKIIFDVKIGISTGDALLGLAGSEKIMSYTAMGDVVNVASRLESNCSKLKRDILISKTTYEDVKSKILALEAGKIKLKGKDERVEAYEPIGLVGEDITDKKQQVSIL
ncbi:MAG: adenylate/guanylate cyclase domain-containing protein [Candidatus Gastranaerophilaceae bacterium]